jgi:Flp pilus assembly protein TadG
MMARALRSRRRSREDGAALVEFALIAPVLFLILFGMIDFGFIYNDFLSLRQGVRDGARQGAVGNFGVTTDCGNSALTTGLTTQTKQLICATRDRIGLDTNKMRVAVCLSDEAAVNPQCTTDSATHYYAGGTLVVCGMYPATSRSGFLSTFIGNGAVTTRVAIRIEQTPADQVNPRDASLNNLVTSNASNGRPSAETALTGKDWAFCKP